MNRSALIWTAFGICLAVVLAAMAWISATVVRLEREQHAAQQAAALEENVRLALWRMDSMLLPLIGQEAARPATAYSSLPRQPRLPATPPTFVLNYFQFGTLAKSSSELKDWQPEYWPDPPASGSLPPASRELLLSKLPEPTRDTAAAEQSIAQSAEQVAVNVEQRQSQVAQQALNISEYQSRARNTANLSNQRAIFGAAADDPSNVRVAMLTSLWIDDELLLARRVPVEAGDVVQGLRLDWPAIRTALLDEIRDLLPGADLLPVGSDEFGDQSRRLTTIPVRLETGTVPRAPASSWSVTSITLLVSWVCTLAAALLAAGLLYGVISLSNRRSTFVSAVTHELRTPLTTFQLYTEMLDEGRVRDEAKQMSYVRTLRAEAARLAHLVENVLAYAQLERGSHNVAVERIAVPKLIERVGERVAQRATQADMRLDVQVDPSAVDAEVRVDPGAVERIVFNLVDNACKYASGASHGTIELRCHRADQQIEIRVSDRGPGLSADVVQRLFRPFSKSAAEAARTKPGIGLGLALSRRLARDLGGDLRHDASVSAGASFVLTLPIATSK
jgi:signal transduction histidine kinase